MASITLFDVVISYVLNKEVRDDAQVQKKQGRINLQSATVSNYTNVIEFILSDCV